MLKKFLKIIDQAPDVETSKFQSVLPCR